MAQKKSQPGEGVEKTLLSQKLITQKQLERVHQVQEDRGSPFIPALISSGLVTDGVLRVLADEGYRIADLSETEPDPTAASSLDEKIARRHMVVPVGFDGDRLVLAMADTEDRGALDEVAAWTGLVVEPALGTRSAIQKAIDATFGAEPADAPTVEIERVEVDESELGTGDDGEIRRVGQRMGVGTEEPSVDVHELLEQVLVRGASDLHLTTGIPPTIRLNGDLMHMTEYAVLTSEDLQKIVYGMLTQKQRERLENDLELDFSYSLPGKARFRVNIYVQRSAFGAAMRLIPFSIKSMEDLRVPMRVAEFARLPRGLVVVTGPTGSGKSTTLASVVDIVNRERPVHIMTIEDPIEFLHTHKKAVVNQREVGSDTHGFAQALRHVLRQDPDVILVGELRDLETIQMAVTAAETGHLVLGTLHTQDAPQTIDRIIDVFPSHQQSQIRVQLAGALQGVVAQQLLQTADGEGRVVAIEILVATPAVRNLIREGKTHQIYSSIQAGGQYGMQTMDSALAELVRSGLITHEAGRERAHSTEEFARLVGGGSETPAGAAKGQARVVG